MHLDLAARPAHLDLVDARRGAEAEVQRAGRRASSSSTGSAPPAPGVRPPAVTMHRRADRRRGSTSRPSSATSIQPCPPRVVVAQQRRRLVHVHDEHVDVAVVVEVAEGGAAARVRVVSARAARGGHVLESRRRRVCERRCADPRCGYCGELPLDLRVDVAGDVEEVVPSRRCRSRSGRRPTRRSGSARPARRPSPRPRTDPCPGCDRAPGCRRRSAS